MMLMHRLTGYEKATEKLFLAHEIPRSQDRMAREVAAVSPRDFDAVGAYPLDPEKARRIARLINKDLNTEKYDWFFEPVAAPLPR